MPETSPNESAHSASVPSEIEIHLQYQQRVTEIALACAIAVNVVSRQSEIVVIPGMTVPSCDPLVFQWSVDRLWKAIVPIVVGDSFESDPYARKQPVRWPGFRPARGKKRGWIYSTSYHFLSIQIATKLYRKLALIGMVHAPIDYQPYFDDNGLIDFWSIPEFQSFATTPWSMDLAIRVLAEAREADPTFDITRFEAEITIEVNTANEELTLRRALTKDAEAHAKVGHVESSPSLPTDTPAVDSNDSSVSRNQQATLNLLSVYTKGMSDERILNALDVRFSTLNTHEKLTEIDKLLRLPATASAESLGTMLGVSKQAVLKTNWWQQNRSGEKQNEIGKRHGRHRSRGENSEPTNGDNER